MFDLGQVLLRPTFFFKCVRCVWCGCVVWVLCVVCACVVCFVRVCVRRAPSAGLPSVGPPPPDLSSARHPLRQTAQNFPLFFPKGRWGFTRQPESPDVDIGGSRPSKSPPKFNEKTPRDRKKKTWEDPREGKWKWSAGEGKKKKSEILCPYPSGLLPLWASTPRTHNTSTQHTHTTHTTHTHQKMAQVEPGPSRTWPEQNLAE